MFSFINKQNRTTLQTDIHDLVGCFGKLPVHADFIKHNLRVREAIALDEWVQDGVTLLNRLFEEKWKNVFRLSPNFRFAFRGGEDDKLITGVIAPGRDTGGRDYPFVVFRVTDNSLLRSRQSLTPLVFNDCYCSIDNLLKQKWDGAGLAALTTEITSCSALNHELYLSDAQERAAALLNNTTIGELWDEVLPGADSKLRTNVMYVVVDAINTVLRRSPQRIHWGLRLPLPANENSSAHMHFWLALCEAILDERNWKAHVIWNPPVPGIPPRMMVFFHQIPASYFTLLIDTRRNDDTMLDILHEAENLSADPARVSKYHFPDDMTLEEVINEVSANEVIA